MLAVDKGPGMRDLPECLRDGFSSSNTPGIGLGAIRRMSDVFDIYTGPGLGTTLLSRFGTVPGHNTPEIGVVSVPLKGERSCGDGWAVRSDGRRINALVVDGLGHGSGAETAALAALDVFARSNAAGPAAVLEDIHTGMRHTRGAAGAVAQIDPDHGVVRFAGIGNIAGALLSHSPTRNLASLSGTLGHEARRFQEFSYPWDPGTTLVMHSDGISARWDIGSYPGLSGRHPSLIAGVLFRDFRRERDDATILVLRGKQS
jgi:hypothetical protein